MTNKDIEDAISKCEWLSDNRPLKELFKKEVNEDDKQGEANTINEGNVS